LLRDPVDRFLSQYWFYRALGKQHALDSNNQPHHDPQVRAAADHDLEGYLALDATVVKLSYTNVQASHFARRLVAYPDALSEDALFQAATMALEDYDLIGIFDDTQGLVDAIAEDMGLEKVRLPRLNITFDRKKVDETPRHLLEKLRASSAVDIRLYEWARERFARQRAGGARSRTMEDPLAQSAPVTETETDPSLDFGTREAEIRNVRCVGERSGSAAIVSGEMLHMTVECGALAALDDVTLGIAVRDRHGQLIYGTNSRLLGMDIRARQGPFVQRFSLQGYLAPGRYTVTAALHRGESHVEGCYHWKEHAGTFTVTSHGKHRFEGVVDLRLCPEAETHAVAR
jgi:hypothetical protein